MAHGQGGAEIGFDRGPCLTCNHEAPIAAYPVSQFGETAGTLTARYDSSPCADRGMNVVAFHPTQDPISSTDGSTHAMGTGSAGGCATVAVAQPVAFQSSQSGVRIGETHATLDANNGPRRHNGALVGMAVRRLTPVECERLQGFPDGYTQIPWRKKPADECPDGPRYKALGNSWAVPCVSWIGQRIRMEVLKGLA